MKAEFSDQHPSLSVLLESGERGQMSHTCGADQVAVGE